MITKEQSSMISMIIEGYRITDIAKKLNISRTTVYAWMELDCVKAETNRRERDIINQATKKIMYDVDTYIDNIKELANDKSDKRTSLAANQYLLNRIYGSPTHNVATEDKADNKKEDFDLDILDEVDLSKAVKLKAK